MLVARGMRDAGNYVTCVGLADQFDLQLPQFCHQFHVAGILRIGKWCRILRKAGVNEAVMVGYVSKARMHDRWRVFRQMPDWRAAVVWYRHLRHDRRSSVLLAAVAEELQRNGITLIDSTTYIKDQMADAGVMTRTQPSASQRADIDFGWPLLSQAVELDIGQSMAVRERDVVAVEALEGTDAMMERAGQLCGKAGGGRGGWVLLKTSREDHDMRADVPTIGLGTIERAARLGCGCIAVGAGRVIVIDKPAVIAAADERRIAIVGVNDESPLKLST